MVVIIKQSFKIKLLPLHTLSWLSRLGCVQKERVKTSMQTFNI